MTGGLLESVMDAASERRIYGAVVATVVSNTDQTGQGRVQIRIPWLSDNDPWARVAMPSAGKERGMYFIPQEEDEVLVIFANGDVRDPYVVGSLWNGVDTPPASGLTDPTDKRIIKTPKGHEVELDDQQQSITITSIAGHTIVIDQNKIEIATSNGTAKLTLESSGAVTMEGNTSVTIKAPQITLDGTTLELKANADATLKSTGVCTIQGSLVKIN